MDKLSSLETLTQRRSGRDGPRADHDPEKERPTSGASAVASYPSDRAWNARIDARGREEAGEEADRRGWDGDEEDLEGEGAMERAIESVRLHHRAK